MKDSATASFSSSSTIAGSSFPRLDPKKAKFRGFQKNRFLSCRLQ